MISREVFLGTEGERLVYEALLQEGRRPEKDFDFLPSLLGGRIELGGVIAQFVFSDPPNLAIRVKSNLDETVSPSSALSRDAQAKAILAGYGFTLVQLDEEDVVEDARGQARMALRYEQPRSTRR